jgi:hypothetical protein
MPLFGTRWAPCGTSRERKGNNHRAQPPKLYTPEELKIARAAAAAAAAAEEVAARRGHGD